VPKVSTPGFSVASELLSHFSLPVAVDDPSGFSPAGAQPANTATEMKTTPVINPLRMGGIIAHDGPMRQE